MSDREKGRGVRRVLIRAAVALCLLLLLIHGLRGGWFRSLMEDNLLPVPIEGQAGFALHMIEVGQGQALLLTCGGEAAMIDTGLPETAERVVSYVRAQGVRQLSCLFVTHPHSDHCGGAKAVLDRIGADLLVLPEYHTEEALLTTAGEWIGKTDTQIAAAAAGQTFAVGEATVTVLHPPAGNAIDDLNELSMVLLVEYGGKRLLFTGDVSAAVEESLLPLEPVDVLQVAHHGSYTSSSPAFLADTAPRYALISCGRNNDYGHPHQSVVDRLKACGAEIFRTDEDGTVVVRISQGKLTVETENEE